MAGRKPITDSIKLAVNTMQMNRRQKTPASVKLLDKVPRAPASLNAEAAEKWVEVCQDLIRLQRLERQFFHIMELLCLAWERMMRNRREADCRGMFETKTGYRAEPPEAIASERSEKNVARYLEMLGLTPVSAKGMVSPPVEADNSKKKFFQ